MPTDRTQPQPEPGPVAALKALTDEVRASENRVRNLIGDDHWQTDGEHKESILRRVLRERLPRSLEVRRGFIVGDEETSGQIDVLVVDNSKPAFMQDGDLVFVGADAVAAIVEVKSGAENWGEETWRAHLQKLNDRAKLCRLHRESYGGEPPFVGLFALHGSENSARHAARAAASIGVPGVSSLTHIAVESKYLIRSEPAGLSIPSSGEDAGWWIYSLDKMAFGYFVGNLTMWLAPAHVDKHARQYFPIDKARGRPDGPYPFTTPPAE